MGRNALCLEQQHSHRTILWCSWHLCDIYRLGVPNRRCGHDTPVNGGTENRSLKLRGNSLLLRGHDDIIILSADLFPGGERRDTYAEWCLHVTSYFEPDGVCYSIWIFRYDLISLFIPCSGINS